MISIAIVGVGGYGGQICRTIRTLADKGHCRLIAAADSRMSLLTEQSEQLASEGVELYENACEMFAELKGRCQTVSICAGVPAHLRLARAAAEAGFHIHLEKPPAPTVQDTDRITEAVQQAGVMCMLGFHKVHSRTLRFIKDAISKGKLGKINTLTAIGLLPRKWFYYTRNGWAGKLRVGNEWVLDGIATNAMCHEIHSMLYLASPAPGGYARPISIRGELYSAWPIEGHDTAAIEIRTEEGPRALMVGSHVSEGSVQPVITIEAEKGTARWERHKATVTYDDGTCEQCELDSDMREEMLLDFLNAIECKNPASLTSTCADGRAVMVAVNAAHDSSGVIHRIPTRYLRKAGGEPEQTLTVVDHMDDYLLEAVEQRCLLSDLESPPPWASATRHVDASSYESFPVSFRCH